ncbi:Coiled-coil domain-containing protein 12 [Thoreauomyces humboldtii]|nr:Coiled-coil domain-containing protein 12 [Thoreauomyces humboldtii]
MDLQAEARKRKERLAALREARVAAGGAAKSATSVKVSIPAIRLREDGDVPAKSGQNTEQDGIADQEITADSEEENREPATTTLETTAKEIAREALEADENRSKEVEIADLAPKRPNFDLKRDLDAKLAKLQRRTEGCIADLIRARLKAADGDLTAAADVPSDQIAAADSDED